MLNKKKIFHEIYNFLEFFLLLPSLHLIIKTHPVIRLGGARGGYEITSVLRCNLHPNTIVLDFDALFGLFFL